MFFHDCDWIAEEKRCKFIKIMHINKSILKPNKAQYLLKMSKDVIYGMSQQECTDAPSPMLLLIADGVFLDIDLYIIENKTDKCCLRSCLQGFHQGADRLRRRVRPTTYQKGMFCLS